MHSKTVFRQPVVLLLMSWVLLLPVIASANLTAQRTDKIPTITLPASPINANSLAVIVNDKDPLSVRIASYYQQKRYIPNENIIRVSFAPGKKIMPVSEFKMLMATVKAKISKRIQAFVLTWAEPYRVGCMSISSAFAFGFDSKFCAKGCQPTYQNRYIASTTYKPFDHYGIRPTMLLAATNFADARALIDRGVASDASLPEGAAYLVTTPDKRRNIRKIIFPEIERQLMGRLPVHRAESKGIVDKRDVMFYFTGDIFVKNLGSNRYLPGAIADHLTSGGGQLTDSSQMSALRWLQAGATGSYGTVVEPCNMLEKFPNPLVVIKKYLQGETLMEAYWKSVKMPGQGVFIGEPLAAPYRSYRLVNTGSVLQLKSSVLSDGVYAVLGSQRPKGPYRFLTKVELTGDKNTIRLSEPFQAFYKIKRLQPRPERKKRF